MPKPRIGYRALRRTRVSLPGHVYHVTTSTHRRLRLFDDFRTARVAVQALNHQDTRRGSEILAWVLMPDHLHMLLQLGEEDDLSQLVGRLKSRVGRVVNRHLNRAETVWQSGYHEHLLRGEEDLKALARYVVMNPLRAGLVTRVSEYPHWDAVWL